MILSSRKISFRGFTLLELLLAIGLCAILALVSVPSVVGWMAELRLRGEFDGLAELVQQAKLEAETEGKPQLVVVLKAGQQVPEIPEVVVRVLKAGSSAVWTLRQVDQSECASIHIDRRGYVDPVKARLTEGTRFVEGQFDFLTGHLRETEVSF